ncbi:threonine-phosphate decarboxylase CobD [Alkalihalobacillus sp. MEB130]|uniref:threonine-phosphate decarboxylase CobD n=1 Tax=Alkalihalobacillus sp. MEB130 TaxID=2976704 RepID=UPI0028DE2B0A|nr:threonine-phosphate decarboxylase CobD [Alkalihalobacillus sp. MEB130]MDT8859293.1 threonine-phosphate decarboxylase CobD [Alkalihalobacillus sp. MEB130]
MKWPNHGGQPEEMQQLFGIEKDTQMLDFSANLNPIGPPDWVKEALNNHYHTITQYPDPTYSHTTTSLADYEGLDKDQVLLTNGGSEAIFLVAKYFENGKSMIVHPTFLEYERACHHYHIETEDVFYKAEEKFQLPLTCMLEKLPNTDVIFLCRPNNPTGTVIKEEDLRRLLEEGMKTGTTVVVDEAFVDFLPTTIPSLTKWLSIYPNLVLLRSLTKMYTIPGLRVGYMMAHKDMIKVLREEQIPWSVNSLVDAIVPRLLDDTRFVEKTRTWLNEQSKYMFEELTNLGYILSPSKVNFYLLQDKMQVETDELFRYLLNHGIVTRHTHNFKGLNGTFIRVAVRSKEENEQLLYVLKKWRNEG